MSRAPGVPLLQNLNPGRRAYAIRQVRTGLDSLLSLLVILLNV